MKAPRPFSLLCLSNDPVENYVRKGTISNYGSYVNPRTIFQEVMILSDALSKEDLPSVRIQNLKIYRVSGLIPLRILRKLTMTIKIARVNNSDVIRAFNPLFEGFAAVVGGLVCRTASVVSVHSDYQLLSKLRGYPLIARIFLNALQRFVYRFSTRVFCVSNGLSDYVISMNANPDKVRVIYNRIKTEKFRTPFRRDIERKKLSLEKGVDPNTFILLYVGRICPEKDLSCTLEAIKILKDDGYDVCLLVVGDELPSPFVKPLKDALLLKMKRLGIENNVKITGFRPNNELPLYYRLADAFVFPSKVYGFGVALAEAQSAGLPILVSNALYPSDHGDIVSPENALVFDPVDSTDLAKKISLLIKNESLRERLSQLGLANSWKYGSARIEEQEAAYYSEIWGEARY